MNIFYFLTTLAGTSTVIIWLGKFIITKTVDVGVERYKAELVKDVEKHKAELSRINFEYQIKFSKLHEDRGEKIKLLYHKIIELKKILGHSTTLGQGGEFGTDTIRDDESLKTIQSLVELVELEKIYFSNSTIFKFNSLIKESKEILLGIMDVRSNYNEYYRLSKTSQQVPEEVKIGMYRWKEVDGKIEKEFEQIKEELANEFRLLLGITQQAK